MLKRYIIIVMTTLLVLSLLAGGLFGCKAEEPEVPVLTFAAIDPLSGAAAGWGYPCASGFGLGVNVVNETGGIKVGGKQYIANFRQYDSRLDATEATAALTKAIDQFTLVAIQACSSGDTMAMQPIAEENGVFLFTGSWTNLQLDAGVKYTFRMQTGSYEPLAALYGWLSENDPTGKIGLSNINYEGGIASKDAVEEFVELYGLNLVFNELYPSGTTDFTPMLTKAIAAGVEYYDTGISTGDAPLIAKQLYELGFKGKLITAGDVIPNDLIKVTGTEVPFAVSMVFQNLPWHTANATPAQKALHDRFWSETGQLSKNSLAAYQGVKFYRTAAEAVDSLDPDKIAKYIEENTFDTVIGPLSFPKEALARYGVAHQIDQPAIFCEFIDNQGNWDLWFMQKPTWLPKK